MNFQNRSYDKEIMDESNYSFEEFAECLNQLNTINKWTQGYRPITSSLNHYLKTGKIKNGEFSLLDVGSGLGDTLGEVAQWARSRGLKYHLVGVDLNPWCVRLASQNNLDSSIQFIEENAFSVDAAEILASMGSGKNEKFDFIVNSLFTHHLLDQEIIQLIQWMSRESRIAWVVNDLHRHPLPYYFIKGVTQALDANRLIKNDAPLSVARGFTKEDWYSFIDEAQLSREQVDIRWFWSFRHCIRYSQKD